MIDKSGRKVADLGKMTTSGDEVRVRFITSDPSIRVVDTPVAVPITLARYGLSQIVNHLLDRGTLVVSRRSGQRILIVFCVLQIPRHHSTF